ncbi:Uncharacterised protein [uncultured archaeon]|nr:Uncharacterised protein [uncultured archaeon]
MEPMPESTIANFPHGMIHCSESGKNDTVEYSRAEIETWVAKLKAYFETLMLDKEHLVSCPACKAGMFCNHIALASQLLGIPEKEAIAMVVKARTEGFEEYICRYLVKGNPKGKTKAEQKRYCRKKHKIHREDGFSHDKSFYECVCFKGVCNDYCPRGPKKQKNPEQPIIAK